MNKILSFNLLALCLSNSVFALPQHQSQLNCEAEFITSSFSRHSYRFQSLITFKDSTHFIGKTTISIKMFGPYVDDLNYRELAQGKISGSLIHRSYRNQIKAKIEYLRTVYRSDGVDYDVTKSFDLNWEYFSGMGRMNSGEYKLECSPEF